MILKLTTVNREGAAVEGGRVRIKPNKFRHPQVAASIDSSVRSHSYSYRNFLSISRTVRLNTTLLNVNLNGTYTNDGRNWMDR
jgi:hypothetical protein